MADHRHILRRLSLGDHLMCTVCNQVFPNLGAAGAPAVLIAPSETAEPTPEERAAKLVGPCGHGLGGYDGVCETCTAAAIRAAVAEEREAVLSLARKRYPCKFCSDRSCSGCVKNAALAEIEAAIRARA